MPHLISFLLIGLLFFSSPLLWGQDLVLVKKVNLDQALSFSVDKKSFIYVGDQMGNIRRFDIEGKAREVYSPRRVSEVNTIEAWFTLRIFAFSEAYQEYILLDRFLNTERSYAIDPDQIGYARAATLSSDDNIWFYDNTTFTLKKIDPRSGETLINLALDLQEEFKNLDIQSLKEYQNLIFALDPNRGLLVFDQLGIFRKLIPYPGLRFISHYQDYLVFIENGELVLYHIYEENEERTVLPPGEWLFASKLDNKIILASEKTLAIYQPD